MEGDAKIVVVGTSVEDCNFMTVFGGTSESEFVKACVDVNRDVIVNEGG